MTCIIGMIDKESNTVIMGGDSAAVAGSSIEIRKDTKVFKTGEFLIGCTSSFRMINLLKYSFKPTKIRKKDIYEYMCTDFINAVRMCFKDGGFLKNDGGIETGGLFLVAYNNRLFKIQDDFQVSECLCGIDAIGCGDEYALGALHAMDRRDIPTKDKVIKALEIVEFLSFGVRRPFVIFNT